MKLFFCILIAFTLNSCASTEEPQRTIVTINNDGTSTVISEYKDSTTVINLNKEGERIDK